MLPLLAMRGFLGLLMYAGVGVSLLAYFLPSMDNRVAGLEVPVDLARKLPWIGLAMVVVGYIGRRALPRAED